LSILSPTRSWHQRAALKENLIKILVDPGLQADRSIQSAAMDTQGLFHIVFGNTAGDIRMGIRLCTDAAALAEGAEKIVAHACLEWRLEAGWRKYFDLSDR
jgi:hypothetical protein